MTELKTFEVGKIYTCSYVIGDGVFPYKVSRRTDKSVWFKPAFGDEKTRAKETRSKIKIYNDCETSFPFDGIISASSNQLSVREYTGA